jgi:small subunit ribosomal protein S4
MLPIKSKYKIAKRLGASLFEKTQSQKFALSEARSKKKRGRGASDYGKQLMEKQRVRYTYGLSERQLSNYAKAAFAQNEPANELHRALELRVDSVIYRAGFASTRRAARQMVSHGHILVNGRRTTSASYHLRKGDVLSVREGSKASPLFAGLAEAKQEGGTRVVPKWIDVDLGELKASILGEPSYNAVETSLDYSTVFEYYSR